MYSQDTLDLADHNLISLFCVFLASKNIKVDHLTNQVPMLQDKWFIASNLHMSELLDLKTNYTFSNKALTLIFSHEEVWYGFTLK